MDRLHRTRLLIGDIGIEKLRNSTVMVVGCGAVGSFAVEALARHGVGHLIVIDSDKVEESNINRQLLALSSTVGESKVNVAKTRIIDINPDTTVDAVNMFFDANTKLDFTPDFVIDAIDTTKSKIALYQWCTQRDIPFISSMGAAMKTDVSQIRIAKISQTIVCPLASKIRKMIKGMSLPDFPVVYSAEKPHMTLGAAQHVFGSDISVTGTFGLWMANYVVKCLLHK